MLRKKSTSREKKRKHSQSEEQHVDRRRRCTESSVDSKDEQPDQELHAPASDVEEGGLDLSVPFKPISAYITDRQEMLEQCFHVLGESKLQKMLPDELKSCSLDEIKKLCSEQVEQLSKNNLLKILEGEELTGSSGEEEGKTVATDSQQDNNVDSTSSVKESVEMEDLKQEGGASGEESDVLSINADTYDSDIEGHKDERPVKTEKGTDTADIVTGATSDPTVTPAPATENPVIIKQTEPKKELQKDIDKSVSEILALGSTPIQEEAKELMELAIATAPETPVLVTRLPAQSAPIPGPAPVASQPSVQQLELLELEMRARAIKALMKANDVKKQA